MVGRLTLDQEVGVRIPAPQPQKKARDAGLFASSEVEANSTRSEASRTLGGAKKLLPLAAALVGAATTTRCTKGTTVSKRSRSFATDGTRKLLWHIAGRQDVCHVSVSATVKGSHPGYVSVDVYR
jgi:hypothetical protein